MTLFQYCNVDGHGIDIYCITKTALLGMTKGLTPQLAQSNIRINSVAPGPIETEFFNGMTNRMAQKNLHRDHKAKVPLRRRGTPDEVASVITFLASDDAAYITGENIIIAGGLSSRL
ncbi:hypothetical protein CAPTEDRAFT_197417 [Capitella teleta]|uniref:Uncharacterized protein n=1 Tax=Capitella teleta TaxID=283909 RepID=R7U0X8_CAPTE|nr:hypothetical protein CAPTEDRAFT_197417 [Capitella teleta]|eukprot:ELT97291.1 hypothetical protein CAPTEDRAFT_197417 [Capitella teleta]